MVVVTSNVTRAPCASLISVRLHSVQEIANANKLKDKDTPDMKSVNSAYLSGVHGTFF